MISEDADLRGRQLAGLVLICLAMVLAIGCGILLGFVIISHHRGALAAALICIGCTFALGLLGALMWALACGQDMKRHPNGNVARNRIDFGKEPPTA